MPTISNLAASSSTGQVPIWAAFLFAIGGAAITVAVQVVSGHNTNRRQDGLAVLQQLVEFVAAGHILIRTLPAGELDSAAAQPIGDQRDSPSFLDRSLPTDVVSDIKEAFVRIENSYAALILVRPELRSELAELRESLARFADEGPRDDAIRTSLHQDLETLARNARDMIFIPITGLRWIREAPARRPQQRVRQEPK